MTSDIISISPEEARNAIKVIQDQSVVAQEAISKVRNSPSLVPNWRGKRRQLFEQTVADDMQQLKQTAELINETARRIEQSMVELMRADGIGV